MSEIEDLIGIYGAIDQAVVNDPSLVDVVAPFLGPYRDGAAGWFDEFTTWTAGRLGTGPSDLFPTLDDALRNLHHIAPRGRMRARRLLAVAVAARVFEHVSLRGSHVDLALGALAVDGLAPEDDALELLRLLTDDDEFGGLSKWSAMIGTASERNLIPESTALQGTAPPCSGRLVMVQLPGDTDPVATLSTHFCTDQLTLEQAKRFLEPVNWPDCNPLWCEMTQTGTSAAGNPTYREVVSVNCANKDQVWTAEACLEFRMINVPNGAIVTYDLCAGHPQPGDMVLVDSGSLTVLQQGAEVCVWTTKRVKFDHPFDGPSLTMLSCALGYGAVAEDLVFNCALAAPDQKDGGTKFPGTDPPTMTDQGGQPVATQPRQPRRPEVQAAVKDAVDEAVDAAKQCIEDCADAYQASYGKVMAGSYKADDLVNDMSKMWSRMVHDGAMVVDLGMKATRAATTRPDAQPEAATTKDGG